MTVSKVSISLERDTEDCLDGHRRRCERALPSALSISRLIRDWMCLLSVQYLPVSCSIDMVDHILTQMLRRFIFNVTMISLRFYHYPSTFIASITHPTESLFVPAWLISFGTILINITQYGTTASKTGPWLLDVMFVLFWFDAVLAVVFSCGICKCGQHDLPRCH